MVGRVTKTAIWIVLAVTAIGVAIWSVRSMPESSPGTSVGIAIALTGYGAASGGAQANAIELLRERFPTISFIVEDHRSDPAAGISAARKLIDVDGVRFLYTDLTPVANAILPISDRAQVPLVAAVDLKDLVDRSSLSVRNLPTARQQAELVLRELERVGWVPTRLVAVGSNDEFGRAAAADFAAAAEELLQVRASTEFMPDDEKQIPLFARQLATIEPDSVYIASLAPSLGVFVSELRVAGFLGSILSDAYAYDYIKAVTGYYWKGTLYPDFAGGPDLPELAARYRTRFGSEFSPVAGLLYDGMSFLLQSHLDTGLTGTALLDSMNNRTFNGVLGSVTMRNRELHYPLVVRIAE